MEIVQEIILIYFMFSSLKRGVKKAIIFFLVLGAIFIVVLTITNLTGDKLFSKSYTKVLIDSDSGNDIDDLFAITRALIEPDLKVVGLTSVHWEFAENAGDSSLMISQKMNENILQLLQFTDIPHPEGATSKLRFNDGPVPKKTPAADLIIQKAHESKKNEKLNIIALGALSNVASAIILDPEIIPKVRVYLCGMYYDPKFKVWNKNEFNIRNDLDALDYLLNTSGLELNIMPVSTSNALTFRKREAEKYFKNEGNIWDFILGVWDDKFLYEEEKILQSVSIIEALADNSLVKSEETLPPPENNQRSIKVYTYLNKELMTANFYAAVIKFQRTQNEK